MANPFLEDFLKELEEIEKEKLETEPIPQPAKSFAYDVVGSTLWAFADEAGFGLPELAARKLGYEEQVEELMPEATTAKVGAGFGALAGFALGLPYKTGTKIASYAVKPFAKDLVGEAGEYAMGQTAMEVAKKTTKKAVDAGLDKEVAEDFTNKYINFTNKATLNRDVSKDFVQRSSKVVDDLISHHKTKGSLDDAGERIVNDLIRPNLTRRPVGDFRELFAARNIGGERAALLGNIADEVIVFGAIDAISEGVRSTAQDRPYDAFAPVWGGFIGAGFGGLRFLSPKGKSSNFRQDFVDGIKGYMGKDIFSKMGKDKLEKQSRWLSKQFEDSAVDSQNLVQTVRLNNRDYTFDLRSPEQLSQHGSELATQIMRSGLNKLRKDYSKDLINYSLKEEWSSLSENFTKMAMGGLLMSSRTLYEMTRSEDIPADEIIPTMLIGAWINRRGMSRVYDIDARTNEIRKNLSVLNVDTRNLIRDIPTFNDMNLGHMNPLEFDSNLRKARDKAEELNVITDSYDISEQNLTGEQSVFQANQQTGKYEEFIAFHRSLSGQKKYVKPLDRITTKEADQIMDTIKDVKWDQLDGRSIENSQDMYMIFDGVSDQKALSIENGMGIVIDKVSKLEELDIDLSQIDVSKQSMGKFPKEFLISDQKAFDQSFAELIKEGRVVEGMEGADAYTYVSEYVNKLNKIVKILGPANEGGIARLDTQPIKTSQYIKSKETFDSIKKIIDEFEAGVNAVNGNKGVPFNINEHMDDVAFIMQRNATLQSAQKISTLMSQDNPIHEQFQILASRAGILRTETVDGQLKTSMINDIGPNNIVIETRDKKPSPNEGSHKRFLGSILSILGAKGEYSRAPSKQLEVLESDILSLKQFLGKNGMRTDDFVLDKWNNFTVDFINRKKVENTELDVNDISFVTSMMDKNLGLAEFNKDSGKTYTLNKIDVDSILDSNMKSAAEAYNAHVDDIIKRGKSGRAMIITPGTPVKIIDRDVLFALEATVNMKYQEGAESAGQILTQMYNSMSANYATFTDQTQAFLSSRPEHVFLFNKMLVQNGIITKDKTNNKTVWSFDESKLNENTISKISKEIDDYGVTFDDVDALLQRQNEEMQYELNKYNDKPIDTTNTLSQDQYWKAYIKDDADVSTQNMYIEGIYNLSRSEGSNPYVRFAESAQVKFGKNEKLYKDLDFNDHNDVRAYREYLDHTGNLFSTRLNSTKKRVLSWENGNVVGMYRTMQKTPFMDFMDSISYKSQDKDLSGINYYILNGSAENILTTDRGIQRRQFNIFDGNSDNLNKNDAKMLKDQEQEFITGLSKQSEIDVRKSFTLKDSEVLSNTGGMEVFNISAGLNRMAIPRAEIFKIIDAYEDMLTRNKDSMPRDLYESGLRRLEDMKKTPEAKRDSHENALRHLLFEKLLSSDGNKTLFYDALKGNSDIQKLGSRFNLFHTPNFKRVDFNLAKHMAYTPKEKDLVNSFIKRKVARVAIWNDNDNNQVSRALERDMSPKEVEAFFDKELHGRGDESAYDSITYISEDYMNFLKIVFNRNSRDDAELFKPVISSNKDALLFGKTVFVREPKLDKFFKNNEVDILTTASASKVKGTNWETLNMTDTQLINAKLSKYDASKEAGKRGEIREISLRDIGIKQDRVKNEDMAKLSQQAYNYLGNQESLDIYNDMYSYKLGEALDEMQRLYDNPLRRRAFFNEGYKEDQSVESLMETGFGSQNLAATIRYAKYGDPMDLGSKMVMSQFYRKVVDPVVNQSAIIDGQRAGGKAVLIQSVDPANKVKATIYKDGELKQYGEVMLPAYEANQMLSMKENEPNRVRILDRDSNKILELEDVFNDPKKKDSFFTTQSINQWTLGQLNEALTTWFPKDKYQVAIITNRYPRTRPNDMTVMGLKGFVDEGYGNSMIVNEMDVLNIFEGDYDVDKNDYFYRHNKKMFNHIEKASKNFIQGIDPSRFSSDIPNIGLEGSDAAINQAWSTHSANSNTLRAGIGVVQKLQKSLNWFKEKLGSKDEDGLYSVFENDDFIIKMDYDNQDWWHRTILETQAIIDAGTGVDKKLIDIMGEWRRDYLFPDPTNVRTREQIEGAKVGFDRTEKRSAYLKEIREGGIPERIPLFRKFDKKDRTKGDQKFSEVEKEMILYHLNKYGKFLSLSTNIYDNSGGGKKPSYEDVINYSDDFFSYMGNHQNMYYYLKSRFKDSDDVNKIHSYFSTKRTTYDDKFGNKKEYIEVKDSPFSENFKINLKQASEGQHGGVYDRIMHEVYRRDPLKSRNYEGLVGEQVKQLDNFYDRFINSEGEDISRFNDDIMGFAKTKNDQLRSLMFLKKKYGFLNRLNVRPKRKQELIELNNQAIADLEKKLEGILPKAYKKSRSVKDLKNSFVKILAIEDNQKLKDDTATLYSLEQLTRHNRGTPDMHNDIRDLKRFEAQAFGDYYNGLGQSLKYGKSTIRDEGLKDYLGNMPNFATINEIIEQKLMEGIQKHNGFHFLYHYAMPTKMNAVGIFNGTAHAVGAKSNQRFERILKFLGKNSGEVEFDNALKGMAHVTSVYKNYFNKNHSLINPEQLRISENVWAFKDGITFPKFNQGMQDSFDSFRDMKWKKDTGTFMDPFNAQDSYELGFYQSIFDMQGRGQDFLDYVGQRSVLQKHLMSTKYIDPMEYVLKISQLDNDIHDFASQVLTGARGEQFYSFANGKVSQELKTNPIFQLMGGEKYFKGISLDPANRSTNYDASSIAAYSKQARTIIDDSPESSSVKQTMDYFKSCSVRSN